MQRLDFGEEELVGSADADAKSVRPDVRRFVARSRGSAA